MMRRMDVIEAIMRQIPDDAAVVACNGIISRDTFSIRDREQNFYMIGSMGLSPSIGLGISLALPELPVVILEGDGNSLMGMGNFASIGTCSPPRLYHVIIDSRAYDSTGGQCSISCGLRLEEIARAAGYGYVDRVEKKIELDKAAASLFSSPGPACLLAVVESGEKSDSPRVSWEPGEIATRVRKSLNKS